MPIEKIIDMLNICREEGHGALSSHGYTHIEIMLFGAWVKERLVEFGDIVPRIGKGRPEEGV